MMILFFNNLFCWLDNEQQICILSWRDEFSNGHTLTKKNYTDLVPPCKSHIRNVVAWSNAFDPLHLLHTYICERMWVLSHNRASTTTKYLTSSWSLAQSHWTEKQPSKYRGFCWETQAKIGGGGPLTKKGAAFCNWPIVAEILDNAALTQFPPKESPPP